MTVGISISRLRQVKLHEYAIRFVIGGFITVITGLIAQRFGPAAGGLFLAFPAIFHASATLIEKHEGNRNGKVRGREAAALDAAGAALGTIGLAVFALITWLPLGAYATAVVLILATFAWFAVSAAGWKIRRLVRARA